MKYKVNSISNNVHSLVIVGDNGKFVSVGPMLIGEREVSERLAKLLSELLPEENEAEKKGSTLVGNVEPFEVKHYSEDAHPTIKGNGFDGLVVGNYREEAEVFIKFVNNIISSAKK